MNPEHTIGIDIGTHSIKVVIASQKTGASKPTILHAIESPAHGFRGGYIVHGDKALSSLQNALQKAQKEYRHTISEAYFSIGGVGMQSHYVRSSLSVTSKNGDIQEKHVNELLDKAEDLFSAKYPNKKILHIIPIKYRVNDQDVLGNPVGIYGSDIEVKVIFITILEHHYESFINLIDRTNIRILDITAAPLADAMTSLDYTQKTQGCILTNIGSETTTLSTYENGFMTSLEIFNIGSNDITNDIALGLQIPLDQAEKVKISDKHEMSKKRIQEIIHARLVDIFELTQRHLKKLNKNKMLPAGIIFSGGGSQTTNLVEYAKHELSLPADIIQLNIISPKTKRNLRLSNIFSVAYGLTRDETSNPQKAKGSLSTKYIKQKINDLIGQIMP